MFCCLLKISKKIMITFEYVLSQHRKHLDIGIIFHPILVSVKGRNIVKSHVSLQDILIFEGLQTFKIYVLNSSLCYLLIL